MMGFWRGLDKGHTREDFVYVARTFRELGMTLQPTFVAFTPWTTVDGYLDLLRVIVELELVENVAPVQLGIRLLIPEGSRLLELSETRELVEKFDAESLVYPWRRSGRASGSVERGGAGDCGGCGCEEDVAVGSVRANLGGGSRGSWSGSAIVGVGRGACGAVFERALVLLRGADEGAVGFDWSGEFGCEEGGSGGWRRRAGGICGGWVCVSVKAMAERKKLLLFAAKLGYQTRSIDEAARRLGVDVIFVTDRCHQLDDPWGDRRLRCISKRRRWRRIQ